jgi:superfamily II DNA or RNA helicase
MMTLKIKHALCVAFNLNRLRKILKQFSTDKLVKLYGESRIDAISNIIHDKMNESKLVDLIILNYGTQVLREKNIRIALYMGLSDQEQGYILDGVDLIGRKLDAEDKVKLANLRWGRTSSTSIRMLEVLNLDDSYLPPIRIQLPSTETISPALTLYPHQQRLKDNFVRQLNSGVSRLLIHMPTGAGKTRTSIEGIIDYWKANADRAKNIVWLAHSEELCEQAVETFSKIWRVRGDADINIHRLWGGHPTPDLEYGNSIIVAGFQKLYSMLSSNKDEAFLAMAMLRESTEIIIVDEAHKAIAPTYQACIDYLFRDGHTKLIGLTATPGRATRDVDFNVAGDTETDALAAYFDRNRIGLTDGNGNEIDDPIKYLQEHAFLAIINRRKVNTNIHLELTDKEKGFIANFLDIPASVLSRLASSDERNALILLEIVTLVKVKKQVIVFALSVEHAHLISQLLNLQGVKARCVDGATTAFDRRDSIDRYKSSEISVLVNYGVLTTGFDAPNTNAVVITRPTASLVLYSQMIGRGIRGPKVGGNKECFLVDLEDNLVGFPSEKQAFNYFNRAWKDNGRQFNNTSANSN